MRAIQGPDEALLHIQLAEQLQDQERSTAVFPVFQDLDDPRTAQFLCDVELVF